MQGYSALAKLEEAVSRQVELAGDDISVETAAGTILEILEPTIREIVVDLAQQAAAEVAAQLSDYEVDVVISDGEPELRLRESQPSSDVASGSYEARLTLRLPDKIKALIEDAAADTGDSVNSWVVKALSSKTGSARVGRRVSGTVEL